MCGRFTLRTNWNWIAQTFQLEQWEEQRARYNIAPETLLACVRPGAGGVGRELAMLRWGLIPSWAKDPTIARNLINARGETVAEKPSFRGAFRSRRCLVIADGFYEWRKEGSKKQPVYIRMAQDRPFAFAGLWERWNQGSVATETCTIITTEANELLRPVHDRMPVILSERDYDAWLDPGRGGVELLRPYPSSEMTWFPVSTLVNRASHDDPACVEPITP